MRILFLSLVKVKSIDDRGIYTDLLRALIRNGHQVTAITPVERRDTDPGGITVFDSFRCIHVKTLNIQKTGFIEKGLGMLTIATQFKRAIKRYIPTEHFDLILYSTPPITLYSVVVWLKNKMRCKTYLLLKDIFPQNAIDMKMMNENGFLHRYFMNIEKQLYLISDKIGCMSPANVEFLLNNNTYLDPSDVHVNPNSIEPVFNELDYDQKNRIRKKYGLPLNDRILVYGGNLGIPQGIDFLIDVLEQVNVENTFYLIVGNGSEYYKLKSWFDKRKPMNALLLNYLPKRDYDTLLQSCDIGLIFLDKNFRIPNFPSRLLSYLEMGFPTVAATDPNTDIGSIIEQYNCGRSVLAGDTEAFEEAIRSIISSEEIYQKMSESTIDLLVKEYTADKSALIIEQQFS
ncbi:glycosyl transferase [Nonlabens sp. YIK11]|uniref:glycosyltransferase family 4 protein n=1 Tax=Nonlabens sp. YIK11 TaxID=1453349 RepID=UPI0006DC9C88|nr:glycosyltransferase family 4 protein [Nonlabens sp. YIK11]KQC34061.1 glycosyl transferase [Nonlabens sp. YIK11]